MKKYYYLFIMGLLLFSSSEKLRAISTCSDDCSNGYWHCMPLCERSFGNQHGFCPEICGSFYSTCIHHNNNCPAACHEGLEECFTTCERHTKPGYIDCRFMCHAAYSTCLGGFPATSQRPAPAQKSLPHPK